MIAAVAAAVVVAAVAGHLHYHRHSQIRNVRPDTLAATNELKNRVRIGSLALSPIHSIIYSPSTGHSTSDSAAAVETFVALVVAAVASTGSVAAVKRTAVV